jgi:hypothetical protein
VSCFWLRDQGRGWDHLEVLLSLVNRLLRCLVGLLAVLFRSDLSKDAELLVLRHVNQVLRRQLTGRLRWDHADRLWLAALSLWGSETSQGWLTSPCARGRAWSGSRRSCGMLSARVSPIAVFRVRSARELAGAARALVGGEGSRDPGVAP